MRKSARILWSLLVVISLFLIPAYASKTAEPLVSASDEPHMLATIDASTKLAYEGGTMPLTTTPVVGKPERQYQSVFMPGTETLDAGEMRVTILGSGDPFVKKGQSSASVLIEVGNAERDFFFFDLGSGSLANFNGLKLPVTATTKVFLTHLHADHVGDMPTLVWSLAKAGRSVPVEVWGPSGATRELGTLAYAEHLLAAHAWDTASLSEHPSGRSGARMIATEFPHDTPTVVYERNGVTISSFPVKHIMPGPVGYRIDYQGRSVVFTGDTMPTETTLEACKGGVDLLIHESFPSASVFAKKANIPLEQAEIVVNHSHTSPVTAAKVFKEAGARMSAIWHLVVDHDTVGPAYQEIRSQFDGPVTIAQDLTVFNITQQAVVTRQAIIDPVAWPVLGK